MSNKYNMARVWNQRIIGQLDHLTKKVSIYTRPYVAIDVYPRGFVNALYMRIRNLGHSPALDIQVQFDKPIILRERDLTQFNIFRDIPVLGPGDTISFYFGMAVEILKDEMGGSAFGGHISYHDLEENSYSHEFRFDVAIYRNLALVVENQFEKDVTGELEKTRREVEEIARSFRDQRMKELVAALDEQEKQEAKQEAPDPSQP